MKQLARLLPIVLACAFLVFPAAAMGDHGNADDASPGFEHLFNSQKAGTNSDLAFWEDLAFVGNYNGIRTFDISDAASPVLLSDTNCRGPQNDVSVYKARNRLLLITSVDRPQTSGQCPSVDTPVIAGVGITPGFEGLRIFDVTNPRTPVQIASVPTACGSHTHTTIPDKRNQRLLIYVASYPLFGGETPPTLPSVGPRCTPPHAKFSIVEVPFGSPESAHVLKEQPLHADTLPFPGSAAIACHDFQAFLDPKKPVMAAACNSEGQLWDISDPANPTTLTAHTHIRNAALDFWHSAHFTWDGKIVNFNDEEFGPNACTGPQSTDGNVWFYENVRPGSFAAPLLGRYMIPRVRPVYCSAHNSMAIPVNGNKGYFGIIAMYNGGTSIFDYTNPAAAREIAWYTPSGVDGNGIALTWSSYWYNDIVFANDIIRGFDVFQLLDIKTRSFHHLNPQTQEVFQTPGG